MIERMLPRFHRSSLGLFAILSYSVVFAASPAQLSVEMYTVAPVSPQVLDGAAPEAARALRSLPVRISWINCSAPAHPDSCDNPDRPTGLRVRLLPKALAPASPIALGMAMWSDSGGSAALFYDRALSIRQPGLFLSRILGRAMAHEVVHLLLGTTSHADQGLMKREWTSDDLRFNENLQLTPAGIAAVRIATDERIASADGETKRGQIGVAAKSRVAGPQQ
jgi:hypothetical protein